MNKAFTPAPAASPVSPAGLAATFGPITTTRMDGAGGPFNDYDCKIAKARSAGNDKLARELQQARASINLAFGLLEPVWVPTQSQLAIGMMMRVAEVEGVCTLDGEPTGWALAERSAYGMPGAAK